MSLRRARLLLIVAAALSLGAGPPSAPRRSPARRAEATRPGAPRVSGSRFVITRPSPPRWDPRVEEAPVQRRRTTPAISGGTLLRLARPGFAAVSDPDLDRVLVVNVAARRQTAELRLPVGSEPGRLAQDSTGRVHVVLRGSGEVASFDPHGAERRLARRAVCPMPRGITTQGTDVHVACRGGELVTLAARRRAPSRVLRLDRDLRDVHAIGDALHVTRFRSAEVIVVGANGAVVTRRGPVPSDGEATRVAWRSRAVGDELLVLHQQQRLDPIPVTDGGYGSVFDEGCTSVVKTVLSRVGGGDARAGVQVPSAALPVDFDVRTGDGGAIEELVLVAAANQRGDRSVLTVTPDALGASGACANATPLTDPSRRVDHAVAVVYGHDRSVWVQQRAPARITVLSAGEAPRTLGLGGGDTFDTGHDLFHAATGVQVACASCHPEGGEDGHTWTFADVGARRTLSLHDAVGTAPFHWGGELSDMGALVNEVFVRRMSGPALDDAHVAALEGWIGHLPRPRPSVADPIAARRGRRVFLDAGCATCHGGAHLTNGESRSIDRHAPLQVPTLWGVADRLPVMHTGCAETLRARFDPGCGGDAHGETVEGADLDDLIAYLESL